MLLAGESVSVDPDHGEDEKAHDRRDVARAEPPDDVGIEVRWVCTWWE